MISSVDAIIERAFKRALPRIDMEIEKNKEKQRGKEKYLKRIKRSKARR